MTQAATSNLSAYRFRWEGSGLGEATYIVTGAGDLTRLRVRYEATPYQRSIASYDDAGWQRDVVGAIDLLADNCGGRPVPQDLVDAFNAWRRAEYDQLRAQIDANPERYGLVDWETDPVFAAPRLVQGARYLVRWNRPDAPDTWKYGCVGLGWELTTPDAVESAANSQRKSQ